MLALILGALQGAASLADHDYVIAPGIVAGDRRGGARLLRRALAVHPRAPPARPRRQAVLPLYGEGSALAAAGASVLFPPLAILVIAGLAWLLAGGRRRAGEKYAGPAHPPVKKLILVVIDAMKPAMLERAVAGGRAPTLKLLLEEGQHVDDCVAAFPSVTPVCAASIATGTGPEEHEIPGMNWYHRDEGRYIEYGTSFKASQSFGLRQSLTDTIYNMNLEHLSRDVETVFERLDDADVRTAGTTYLMYRGRHRHEVSGDTALTRIASTVFRHAVYGPKELFYADIFASRRTPCRSQMGLPGIRDQHSGCVGEFLVENDLFDFLLLSLPDNDTHSHKNGPFAQVESLAAADRQIERLVDAAGGAEDVPRATTR